MLNSDMINQSLEYLEKYLFENLSEVRTYHKLDHALNVAKSVTDLTKKVDIDKNDREDLVLAALFHDVGYCVGSDNHEEIGARLAMIF